MSLVRRLSAAVMAVAASVSLLTPAPAAASASMVWHANLSPNILHLSYPRNNAYDPIVATHPANPDVMAVSYHWRPKKGAPCGFAPGLRISTDGGATWSEAARRPWAGSGRVPNWHATITWGPGPKGGWRLYWADTTVADCSFGDHRLSVAWSDDLGTTWSKLFVYHGTPATSAGGYPDITVDGNPASPNYGAVYAAINWFQGNAEPGYRVIASADFGKTWIGHEIAPLAGPAGYPYAYRIGYRLRTAPDGGLYASFCQRDRSSSGGGTGRLAYGVARLVLNTSKGTLTGGAAQLARKISANPYSLSTRSAPGSSDWQALGSCWSHGIDVGADGRLHLAIADYRKKPPAGEPRGVIRVGQSADHGQSWSWQAIPAPSKIDGLRQSAYRPTLVVSGQTIFVGLHLMSDVALGSKQSVVTTSRTAHSLSTDGGATFGAPTPIDGAAWDPDWLDYNRNGPGIRDRAELTAGGRVVYVWGDGRHAGPKTGSKWGRGQVYGAAFSLGGP
jgi:hypothetical protein